MRARNIRSVLAMLFTIHGKLAAILYGQGILLETEKITIPSGNFASFGLSVSVDGDSAIVGGPGVEGAGFKASAGAAYIFELNEDASPTWHYVCTLLAFDSAEGDRFGWSVSISHNTAVVGASGDDDGGSASGSAYIFERRHDGVCYFVTKLTASDAAEFDSFGRSVSIDGDTVVIGAERNDGFGPSSGAAYVFDRHQGGTNKWGQVKKLIASDAGAGDNFGVSVAIDGTTVLVGAHHNDHLCDTESGCNSGAAYLFEHDQGGTANWGELLRLTASDATQGDFFGFSVAMSGNTAVVGAYGKGDAGRGSGAAYVFERTHGSIDDWRETVKLTASDARQDERFGFAVEVDESTVAVARNSDAVAPREDAIYLFERNQGGDGAWGEVTTIDSSSGDFGTSISVDKTHILVGASGDDSAGSNAGAVFSYLQVVPAVSPPAPLSGALFGTLDRLLPTIVLTHGLTDNSQEHTDLWTGFGEKQAGALISDTIEQGHVNVVQWVWDGAFQPFLGNFLPTAQDYLVAQLNVPNASRGLASELSAKLGGGYTESVHFVGHSLGVPVNAYAAMHFLNATLGVDKVQFTALDRPDRIGKITGLSRRDTATYGYGPGFLEDVLLSLTRPVDKLHIDNFYSLNGAAVGDVASGPIYNHKGLIDPGKLNEVIFFEGLAGNDHSGVHQWYRWTISAMNSPLHPGIVPCSGQDFNPLFVTIVGLDPSLSPCGVGWQWSLHASPDDFPVEQEVHVPVLTTVDVDPLSFLGAGCGVDQSPGTIVCTTSASGTVKVARSAMGSQVRAAVAQVMVPDGAIFIVFEYRFQDATPGDYAAIFVDGMAIWQVQGYESQPAQFLGSTPISLKGLRGSRSLSVALFTTATSTTILEVRKIQFIVKLGVFTDGFETGDTTMWSSQVP